MTATGSLGPAPQGARQDGVLAAFAPDWIDSGNRVAEAFAAIETENQRRSVVSPSIDAFLLNDPSRFIGR